HQKLIEEAPPPRLRERTLAALGRAAVRAAQAIGYVNAGTVEFLVDKERNFYFIEMNTRLQVEHPVTEMVTGVDIVKEQIRIARGRKLRYRQEDIRQTGWAIECRITAEDPFNNFMPSTGRIVTLAEPTGPGVRVDSGVYEGCEITPYYDSLIAKVIAWGETRGEAILRMRRALEEFRIIGIKTIIPFHQAILNSTRFLAGHFDTKFVEERFAMDEEAPPELEEAAAIIATLVAHRRGQAATHVTRRRAREINGWKWAGRWEQLRRSG
ncbi:MAG: hypothetical protein NZM16_11680, partial [Thermoflexus sp.]|nr:hypothetical protein [Thermoflexus sp.]